MGLDKIRQKHKPRPAVERRPPARRSSRLGPLMTARTELTDELIADLVTVVFRGNYRTIAAQACGVPPRLFYRWIRKGEQDAMDFERGVLMTVTQEHLLFVAINRAEAESHVNLLQDVMDADDYRVKLDFLKHRFKKLYATGTTAREVDDTTGREVESVADVLRDKLIPLLRPEQREALQPMMHRETVIQASQRDGEQELARRINAIADKIH